MSTHVRSYINVSNFAKIVL